MSCYLFIHCTNSIVNSNRQNAPEKEWNIFYEEKWGREDEEVSNWMQEFKIQRKLIEIKLTNSINLKNLESAFCNCVDEYIHSTHDSYTNKMCIV